MRAAELAILDDARDAGVLEQILEVRRVGQRAAAPNTLHRRAALHELRCASERRNTAGIGAALEHLDERGADDDAVGVRAEQRHLIRAPHAEAGANGQARGRFDGREVLRRLGAAASTRRP